MRTSRVEVPVAVLRQRALLASLAVLGTIASAIVAKELVAGGRESMSPEMAAFAPVAGGSGRGFVGDGAAGRVVPVSGVERADAAVGVEPEPAAAGPVTEELRWFNGRPIRPVRRVWMTVTAYSPDARSCGIFADGYTATMHSVKVNDGCLVAADPRVLGYGSLVSVPGYDNGEVVPVLDCGSRIKGARLDVLYPTHARARVWGVQRLAVTVWGYAD